MSELFNTTNSVNDWLGIFGIMSIAVMGLVWRMEKLWYDKIKQEVQAMINDAKEDMTNQIKTHDKKADEMLEVLRSVDKTVSVVKTKINEK